MRSDAKRRDATRSDAKRRVAQRWKSRSLPSEQFKRAVNNGLDSFVARSRIGDLVAARLARRFFDLR
jgi:hypothetical protein